MAPSAHSIPQHPDPQVPNFADRTLRRYAVRLSDGDVCAEVALIPFVRHRWRVERFVSRVRVRRGAMGARQRERAKALEAQCLHALVEGLTLAGWYQFVDAGGTLVWEMPPQAPQEAPQAPQEAPQAEEPPQAPQAPQAPAESALPWNGGGYVSATSRRWRVELGQLAALEMYHHETTGRYEWLICLPGRLQILDSSRGPGYTSYARAEAALLLALHRLLHPAVHLPASLPPL